MHRKIERGGILGRYIRSQDYQLYRPKTEAQRKAAQLAQPEELRRLRLPTILIRTGTRVAPNGTTIVPNRIKRVNIERSGVVAIQTDGKLTLRYLPVKASDMARDPEGTAQRAMERFSRNPRRERVQARTGFGGIGPLARLTRPSEFAEFLSTEIESRYPNLQQFVLDSFQGIVIQERR